MQAPGLHMNDPETMLNLRKKTGGDVVPVILCRTCARLQCLKNSDQDLVHGVCVLVGTKVSMNGENKKRSIPLKGEKRQNRLKLRREQEP